MSTQSFPYRYVENIIKPLVTSGLYKNEKMALKDIVFDYIKRKELYYCKEINKLKKKYGVEFDEFSKKIKNIATIEQEEDWMTWKAANEMFQALNSVSISILKDEF
ncbi:MAG: hypothetical protein HY738_20945 [Bacteroidia bacterium]|nr:hypothetical protein [Bacteroidia bacterium]